MGRGAVSKIIGLRELRGCFVDVGWFRRERMFLATFEDGSQEIVYPVYASRGESPIYVTVAEL